MFARPTKNKFKIVMPSVGPDASGPMEVHKVTVTTMKAFDDRVKISADRVKRYQDSSKADARESVKELINDQHPWKVGVG